MAESNCRQSTLQVRPFPFRVLVIVCPSGIEPPFLALQASANPSQLQTHEEERTGFEPAWLVSLTVFKAAALNHTLPPLQIYYSGTAGIRTLTPFRMDSLANYSDTITAPFHIG